MLFHNRSGSACYPVTRKGILEGENVAEILLKNGEKIRIIESTANINLQKSKKGEYFDLHKIEEVKLCKIKRSDILTMCDDWGE